MQATLIKLGEPPFSTQTHTRRKNTGGLIGKSGSAGEGMREENVVGATKIHHIRVYNSQSLKIKLEVYKNHFKKRKQSPRDRGEAAPVQTFSSLEGLSLSPQFSGLSFLTGGSAPSVTRFARACDVTTPRRRHVGPAA